MAPSKIVMMPFCHACAFLARPQELHLDLLSIGNRYHYNWNTDRSWDGTCRQLIIELKDNSVHTAQFKFAK